MKDEDRGRKPKGSWEEAAAEHHRCWMEQFGVGFFSFDTPDDKRIEEPAGSAAIQNARTSFRTLLTLALRGSLDHQKLYPADPEKPPFAVPQFRPKSPEDAAAGNGLLAEFILQFISSNGDEYFAELLRLWKRFRRDGKRGLPMKIRLIAAAICLRSSLGRNPTREELKEEAKRLGIEVGDWTKTFKDCKLGFLAGGRGRPRKNPG